jgi:hypothetical protein
MTSFGRTLIAPEMDSKPSFYWGTANRLIKEVSTCYTDESRGILDDKAYR